MGVTTRKGDIEWAGIGENILTRALINPLKRCTQNFSDQSSIIPIILKTFYLKLYLFLDQLLERQNSLLIVSNAIQSD